MRARLLRYFLLMSDLPESKLIPRTEMAESVPGGPEGGGEPLNASQDEPLFFSEEAAEASLPNEVISVEEDEVLPNPDRILMTNRQREVARLWALGKTQRFIAKKIGLRLSYVQKLTCHPQVRAEAQRYREKLYDRDVVAALKDLGPESVDVIETMLRDGKQKLKDRSETARWVVEKLTGKAKQEIHVESNTLSSYMDMMKKMAETGETPGSQTIIDVTPAVKKTEEPKALPISPESHIDFESWVKNELV